MEKLADCPPGIKPGVAGSRRAGRYRRTLPPFPIEPYDLCHPSVPPELDGFTILHVSDLHVRRGRPRPDAIRAAGAALAHTPADVVVLTGDYPDHARDTASALESVEYLSSCWRPRLGAFGIMGNHDAWQFRAAARGLTRVRWLTRASPTARPDPDLPFNLWGFDDPEDVFGTLLEWSEREGMSGNAPILPEGLNLALTHYPSEIYPAAEFGFPLVLAGHTHGGQWRATPGLALHTSSDLPGAMASGVLRLRDTVCAVSRGLGGSLLDWRINCPPQIPLYTLRRRAMPGSGADPARLRSLRQW